MYAVEYTWMRNPIPVTTRHMTADKLSKRRPAETLRSPAWIHGASKNEPTSAPPCGKSVCRRQVPMTTSSPAAAADGGGGRDKKAGVGNRGGSPPVAGGGVPVGGVGVGEAGGGGGGAWWGGRGRVLCGRAPPPAATTAISSRIDTASNANK